MRHDKVQHLKGGTCQCLPRETGLGVIPKKACTFLHLNELKQLLGWTTEQLENTTTLLKFQHQVRTQKGRVELGQIQIKTLMQVAD